MDTHIERDVHADAQTIYHLAAAVEDWPRILPHYRWVRVLDADAAGQRTVEMAARRDVVGVIGFPLRWTAVQTLYPDEPRIEFAHVAGVTRGMHVWWTFEPVSPHLTRVRIRHQFDPAWLLPPLLVRLTIGDYFVNGVAQRTLRIIAGLAERAQRSPAS